LKLPPESSVAPSASGTALPAHQTSQIALRTGILRTTRRKKIGQKPVIAQV
jgi:hypothetical protein